MTTLIGPDAMSFTLADMRIQIAKDVFGRKIPGYASQLEYRIFGEQSGAIRNRDYVYENSRTAGYDVSGPRYRVHFQPWGARIIVNGWSELNRVQCNASRVCHAVNHNGCLVGTQSQWDATIFKIMEEFGTFLEVGDSNNLRFKTLEFGTQVAVPFQDFNRYLRHTKHPMTRSAPLIKEWETIMYGTGNWAGFRMRVYDKGRDLGRKYAVTLNG